MPITKFKGQYFFLSNFSPSLLNINGITFGTVEHYYQAMKATCYEDYLAISLAPTPGNAKKLGNKIQIRPDWNKIKDSIMSYAIYTKFSQKILQMQLLSTHNEELIEGNYWGDTYWGVYEKTGIGENKLGKILMEVREYYKSVVESYHNSNYNPDLQFQQSS